MTDMELKEEMRQDMLADARADELHDHKMRSDYDDAYEYLNFNEDMTIAEFNEAASKMQDYWDVSKIELLESI